MKIQALLEGQPERWKAHPTRKGIQVRDHKREELEREDWKRKEQRKLASKKPRKPAAPKIDYPALARKIDDVIGNVVPDGDPIDWLAPYMKKKYGLDYNLVPHLDKALRQDGYKKGYYKYLEDMWDAYNETADEQHKFDVNPWKTS